MISLTTWCDFSPGIYNDIVRLTGNCIGLDWATQDIITVSRKAHIEHTVFKVGLGIYRNMAETKWALTGPDDVTHRTGSCLILAQRTIVSTPIIAWQLVLDLPTCSKLVCWAHQSTWRSHEVIITLAVEVATDATRNPTVVRWYDDVQCPWTTITHAQTKVSWYKYVLCTGVHRHPSRVKQDWEVSGLSINLIWECKCSKNAFSVYLAS